MDALLHQIFSGLASGCIYGSVALGLVMIYQATHHINFAQGEMATFSTFIAWAMVQNGWPYWAAFFITVAVSFVGGLVIQRVILRPVEKAPVLTNVMVFVGLLFIFNSLAGWIFDFNIKSFESPFKTWGLGTRYFSSHDVGSVGVMLAVLAALWAFFRFTPVGLAMRAAAQNPDSARLVGIRVSWMLGMGWGLAAAIGAVAGEIYERLAFPNFQLRTLPGFQDFWTEELPEGDVRIETVAGVPGELPPSGPALSSMVPSELIPTYRPDSRRAFKLPQTLAVPGEPATMLSPPNTSV